MVSHATILTNNLSISSQSYGQVVPALVMHVTSTLVIEPEFASRCPSSGKPQQSTKMSARYMDIRVVRAGCVFIRLFWLHEVKNKDDIT